MKSVDDRRVGPRHPSRFHGFLQSNLLSTIALHRDQCFDPDRIAPNKRLNQNSFLLSNLDATGPNTQERIFTRPQAITIT